jgi:hypothetical protein
MPVAEPDAAVADLLATAGIGLTKGSNLFRGPVRPDLFGVQNKSVFCLATGGPINQRLLGNQQGYTVKTVQVRLRSRAGDFDGGQLLGRQIRDALHGKVTTDYLAVLVREPEPNYLGQDADDRYDWSLNVELHRVG